MRGITPACAGRSKTAFPAHINQPDHPRVCGEEARPLVPGCPLVGSPPRVRGGAAPDNSCWAWEGITPACAGRSRLYGTCPSPRRDHPRVCGEEGTARSCSGSVPGSPPRVRGGGWKPKWQPRWRRITPACAGRSECGSSLMRSIRDHPRVCGEEASASHSAPSATGSPPRVRGGVARDIGTEVDARITPACAGRSARSGTPAVRAPDHPRVCGEEPYLGFFRDAVQGSPPRVRGGADEALTPGLHPRITPACAGRRTRLKSP